MKKSILYKYLLKISIYVFLFPLFISGYILRIYDNIFKKKTKTIEKKIYKIN